MKLLAAHLLTEYPILYPKQQVFFTLDVDEVRIDSMKGNDYFYRVSDVATFPLLFSFVYNL